MIQWTERTVKVKDLQPYERNPRRIGKDAFERLKKSLQDNGYHQRLICQPDLKVIGGHQRIKALKELGIREVAILVPDRELTDDEFRRLIVQDNLAFGEWDIDILSSDFELDELLGWGMPEALLGIGEESPEEGDGNGSPEEDDARIVHCPKCHHEFSILTEKKRK